MIPIRQDVPDDETKDEGTRGTRLLRHGPLERGDDAKRTDSGEPIVERTVIVRRGTDRRDPAGQHPRFPISEAQTPSIWLNNDRIDVTQKISTAAPVDVAARVSSNDAAASSADKAAAPRPRTGSGMSAGSRSPFGNKSRPMGASGSARSDAPKVATKPGVGRQGFKAGEYIVYPAHGVGEIVAIEEEEVAGFKLELFVISFAKDKMKLKVPLPKVSAVGMRKLSEADVVQRALDTLAGRARVKRTMWSRRAQEYEAKINSGDLVSVAEVVRDLYRSEAQPEQSYSERQLYEAALDRMSREIAAVQKLTDSEMFKVIEAQLQKSPRRSKADVETDSEADIEEGDVEEAA